MKRILNERRRDKVPAAEPDEHTNTLLDEGVAIFRTLPLKRLRRLLSHTLPVR
jgi:hypothetical protein